MVHSELYLTIFQRQKNIISVNCAIGDSNNISDSEHVKWVLFLTHSYIGLKTLNI